MVQGTLPLLRHRLRRHEDEKVVATHGNMKAEVNRGLNCVKGYFLSKSAFADDAGHYRTAVDADPELNGNVMLHGVLAGDVDHADSHANHTLGVVRHRHGQAAHRHVGVTHGFDLFDAEVLGCDVEPGEEPVEKRDDIDLVGFARSSAASSR